jgi:predicted DsbA family dithiol-disulfide isomerase
MPDSTITVWSDIGCPWAHVAVARLHRARAALGLDERVRFDHRPFPLELINEQPTPWRTLAGEIPVLHAMDPEAGWQVWKAPPSEWPVTTLPALEAVQAAKAQSPAAAEELDLALRRALFAESRCISMRHVVVDVARRCPEVDADAVAAALDDGRARRAVVDAWQAADGEGVKGSPHLFLPDGTDAHNPGVTSKMIDGMPIVERDDPSVYEDLLRRAVT